MRAVGGERAEAYIARYASFRWDAQSIPEISQALGSLSQADRDVVTIRLANELDDISISASCIAAAIGNE